MSFNAAILSDRRLLSRTKNQNLQTRRLEITPENKKLIADYQELVKQINLIPSRMKGLCMNYRRRELPAQMARLQMERGEKMEKLLEMEKILFPDAK